MASYRENNQWNKAITPFVDTSLFTDAIFYRKQLITPFFLSDTYGKPPSLAPSTEQHLTLFYGQERASHVINNNTFVRLAIETTPRALLHCASVQPKYTHTHTGKGFMFRKGDTHISTPLLPSSVSVCLPSSMLTNTGRGANACV